MDTKDTKYMKLAIKEAQKALQNDEVPIGCVIVQDDKIIARAYNNRNKSRLATAHAEITAINKACRKVGDWRLNNCTIYITLEPCPMCAGAIFNARIGRVVFGASEPAGGAFGGAIDLSSCNLVNHKLVVTSGIMRDECASLLSNFFSKKRS